MYRLTRAVHAKNLVISRGSDTAASAIFARGACYSSVRLVPISGVAVRPQIGERRFFPNRRNERGVAAEKVVSESDGRRFFGSAIACARSTLIFDFSRLFAFNTRVAENT